MSVYPPPDEGMCVCGRPMPAGGVSDWACSESCQSAWLHHQADPSYPHPRQIREAADRTVAGRRQPAAGLAREVAEGTEINVDGRPYVRVGAHWQPAGMWMPLWDAFAESVCYRRWCPTCQIRQASLLYPDGDVQECAGCGHQWQGRPLLGQVEFRGAPWPGVRLRLFDGQRSVVSTFSPEEVQGSGQQMADRMQGSWLRLERQLCGGYADMDLPDERQRRRAARRLARDWHLCADPS